MSMFPGLSPKPHGNTGPMKPRPAVPSPRLPEAPHGYPPRPFDWGHSLTGHSGPSLGGGTAPMQRPPGMRVIAEKIAKGRPRY